MVLVETKNKRQATIPGYLATHFIIPPGKTAIGGVGIWFKSMLQNCIFIRKTSNKYNNISFCVVEHLQLDFAWVIVGAYAPPSGSSVTADDRITTTYEELHKLIGEFKNECVEFVVFGDFNVKSLEYVKGQFRCNHNTSALHALHDGHAGWMFNSLDFALNEELFSRYWFSQHGKVLISCLDGVLSTRVVDVIVLNDTFLNSDHVPITVVLSMAGRV